MAKTKPKPIETVIESLFNQLGLSERLKRAKAVAVWEEVVGDQIARVSKAERMIGKKLFVQVENSVWRNELLFKKREIIQKMNSHLGSKVVDDIRFY